MFSSSSKFRHACCPSKQKINEILTSSYRCSFLLLPVGSIMFEPNWRKSFNRNVILFFFSLLNQRFPNASTIELFFLKCWISIEVFARLSIVNDEDQHQFRSRLDEIVLNHRWSKQKRSHWISRWSQYLRANHVKNHWERRVFDLFSSTFWSQIGDNLALPSFSFYTSSKTWSTLSSIHYVEALKIYRNAAFTKSWSSWEVTPVRLQEADENGPKLVFLNGFSRQRFHQSSFSIRSVSILSVESILLYFFECFSLKNKENCSEFNEIYRSFLPPIPKICIKHLPFKAPR